MQEYEKAGAAAVLFEDQVWPHLIYKICGIKNEDMGWKKYALSLIHI